MEPNPSKTVEMLKSNIESALERIKGLSISENPSKPTENPSEILTRRDSFCANIYNTLQEINSSEIKDELQKVDQQIAQLKRINAKVNWEMIVIKAELSRFSGDAIEDQQISHLESEVQHLEIAAKHPNAEDILEIAPFPKKKCLVPPNTPDGVSDDEDSNPLSPIFDFSGCFETNGAPNKPSLVFKRSSLASAAEEN
ncbi:uncharacterized protein LOC134835851 [Culicoides brevitarsis]|uniref:uncharacterized protein LOC134835851 n=1 Tax=Culicoides brevitarsis TaxID=469753 RepID=UPI00307C3A4C